MPPPVLAQTLVLRGGQVFLGRWRPGSGAFAGRLTGVIGSSPPAGAAPHAAPSAAPPPEAVAAAACAELLGPRARVDPRRLRRRGLFVFEERDAASDAAAALGVRYSEHQLVLRLRPEEAFEPEATETFEPAGWFGPDEVPYEQMPEDDEVWYPRVLFEDRRLRGTFAFDGTRLLEHQLEEVDAAEGLCGLAAGDVPPVPLLIHDPASAGSRAVREALAAGGERFRERNCVEEPLSLSELETVFARLQGRPGGARAGVELLCKGEAWASELAGLADPAAAAAAGAAGAAARPEDRVLEALALRPEWLRAPIVLRGRAATAE